MLPLLLQASLAKSAVPIDVDYDYIVVGGGAAGASGAYALSEAGKKVLLLERGQERSAHPLSHNIEGVGLVLTALESNTLHYSNSVVRGVVSQPTGVISHTANVLGGGTSVNMGILLYEQEEFWNEYISNWDFPIADMTAWIEEHEWATRSIAFPVTPLTENGDSLYEVGINKAMEQFYNKNGDCPLDYRSAIEPGCSWHGQTLFDHSQPRATRKAIDTLITGDEKPSSLTVMTNSEVQRLIHSEDGKRCVTGRKWAETPRNCEDEWFSNCTKTFEWTSEEFTYCIDTSISGGIVLAAGTLETPLILMRSGIGPQEEVQAMENPVIQEEIGRNITDRFFTATALFGYQGPTDPTILTYTGLAELENSSITPPIVPGWQNAYAIDSVSPEVLPYAEKIYGAWEELGGGDMIMSVAAATRGSFEPGERSDVTVVAWSALMGTCLKRRYDAAGVATVLENIITDEDCARLEDLFNCYRYARAMFTMDSSPESRGEIKLSDQETEGTGQWTTNVYMPYLDSEQDRRTHIESIKNLWRSLVDIEEFSQLVESNDECPSAYSRAFVSFVMGDLISAEKMIALKKALNVEGTSKFNVLRTTWEKMSGNSETPFLGVHSSETIDALLREVELAQETPINSWLSSNSFNFEKVDECDIPQILRERSQPPLPCMITDSTALEYISRYGTSIWHWLGSVRRSSDPAYPVGPDYSLRSVPNVFVIDGSIYPHNPRLNPEITIVAGGRYAAKQILKLKQ